MEHLPRRSRRRHARARSGADGRRARGGPREVVGVRHGGESGEEAREGGRGDAGADRREGGGAAVLERSARGSGEWTPGASDADVFGRRNEGAGVEGATGERERDTDAGGGDGAEDGAGDGTRAGGRGERGRGEDESGGDGEDVFGGVRGRELGVVVSKGGLARGGGAMLINNRYGKFVVDDPIEARRRTRRLFRWR